MSYFLKIAVLLPILSTKCLSTTALLKYLGEGTPRPFPSMLGSMFDVSFMVLTPFAGGAGDEAKGRGESCQEATTTSHPQPPRFILVLVRYGGPRSGTQGQYATDALFQGKNVRLCFMMFLF